MGHPSGGPARARRPADRAPQIFFLWAPLQFDDECVHMLVFEEPDGTRWAESALRVPVLAPGDPLFGPTTAASPLGRVGTRCAGGRGLRRSRGATWSLPDGSTIELEPLLTFRMRGIGYLHPEWGHGLWQGELAVHGEAPLRPASTPWSRGACACSRSSAPPGATRWAWGSWSSWPSAPTTRAASTASSTATAADPPPPGTSPVLGASGGAGAPANAPRTRRSSATASRVANWASDSVTVAAARFSSTWAHRRRAGDGQHHRASGAAATPARPEPALAPTAAATSATAPPGFDEPATGQREPRDEADALGPSQCTSTASDWRLPTL